MKIVIKGAGDLATGIASRLYHAGHQIVMTEIAVPLTVRRSVALSRAVYENEAEVEDLKGVLVKDAAEADRILQRGEIPVLVDPEVRYYQVVSSGCSSGCNPGKEESGNPDHGCAVCHRCRTGILRRKRLSLCHRDKKRTYTGKCDLGKRSNPKYRSSGKYRRLYNRASDPCQCIWIMEPVAEIGDTVEKGQLVARTGKQPVYAKMSGIVRGMLQKDVQVTEGLKIGDIDARCEPEHCGTISDKARAVGGGVLEAVSLFGQIYGNYGVALLAAGEAKRFGSDKLSEKFQGIPL